MIRQTFPLNPAEIDWNDIAGHLGHRPMATEPMIEGILDSQKSKPDGHLSSLDHLLTRNNTVGHFDPSHGRYRLITHNCRSWFCPICRPRLVVDLKREWVPVLATFTNILMIALTVDPQLFGSPREAYRYLRDNRCVSETMRLITHSKHQDIRLNSSRYAYVLEFQEENDYYPHFHLLLDASYVLHEELARIWSHFRPRAAGPVAVGRPAFGYVSADTKRIAAATPTLAAKAAIDYITKAPERDIPDWVLDMGTAGSRIAMHGTSRNFFPRIPGQNEPQPCRSRPRTSKKRSPSRPHRDRIEACGQSTQMMRVLERTDPVSGEVVTLSSHWQVHLDVTESELQYLRDNGFFDNHMSEVMAENPDAVVDRISRFLGRQVHRIGHQQPPKTDLDSQSTRPTSRIKAPEFFGQTKGTSNE